MAFPILAVLAAVASDMQNRQAKRHAIQGAGDATRNQILSTRGRQLGGQPYDQMSANLGSQLSSIDRQARDSSNNNIGRLIAAYGKSFGDEPDERMIGENNDIPTVDDLGAGNRSGLSMVDSLFANEPATMPSTGALGSVDSLFGREPSKLYEEDPWGSGAF